VNAATDDINATYDAREIAVENEIAAFQAATLGWAKDAP
jgi:hypothetical protein